MKMYLITAYSTVITHKSIQMKMIKSRADALQLKNPYICLYAHIYTSVGLCIKACIIPRHMSRIMSHKNWNFAIVSLWGEAKWVGLPQ